MSYLGKASNDYACPTGQGDNKTIINVCIRLVVKIQRPSIEQDDMSSGGNLLRSTQTNEVRKKRD